MNIVDFIETRIAEDEQIARTASIPAHDGYKPHPDLTEWQYSGEEVEYVQTPEMLAHKYAQTYYVTCDREGLLPSVEEDVAQHIARHDPARALRQCKALRNLVKPHMSDDMFDPDEGLPNLCTQCREPWPCEDIRLIASIWSNHPDYDTTWS